MYLIQSPQWPYEGRLPNHPTFQVSVRGQELQGTTLVQGHAAGSQGLPKSLPSRPWIGAHVSSAVW